MDDVIQYQDRFYILATSSLLQERRHVLKDGGSFAVFDPQGDIVPLGSGEQGYYHFGTRHLSRLQQTLNGRRPLLLSSRVREQNDIFGADLTNADQVRDGEIVLPRDLLHVFRSRFLWDGHWYERLRFANYGLEPRVARDRVTLGYLGLDGLTRATELLFDPPPLEISGDRARFALALGPRESAAITLTARCEGPEYRGRTLSYEEAFDACAIRGAHRRRSWCTLVSANEQFNEWFKRSAADILMMTSDLPTGPYVYAGVPWFSTPFGRDGIITALEVLWANPELARGTLAYLAETQAADANPLQDAEPGKILHETRAGEMARLGEVPFGRYYGSVDATPLFVVLAGRYYARTGDRDFIASIWGAIERALAWIDTSADADGDGFIEYARRTPKGLVQQGWKDSNDSVFHADGTLAAGPIALSEVQAYVHEAKLQAAALASVLGLGDRAGSLRRAAAALREQFERAFWCEELDAYALALDGEKRPCRVRSSNAGQCLFGGIASPARARRIADTLMGDVMFSGWGVRTIATGEARYNPMSYHNGSIWPHDNALIGAGLGRYGLRSAVARILAGLFDASLFVDRQRMPELFCGFHRRAGEGPTLYPVACSPQAWAAGAVFMLLQSMVGLTIEAAERRVTIRSGLLPEFLPQVRVNDLQVGDGTVDLILERHRQDLGVTIERNDANAEIVVIK